MLRVPSHNTLQIQLEQKYLQKYNQKSIQIAFNHTDSNNDSRTFNLIKR